MAVGEGPLLWKSQAAAWGSSSRPCQIAPGHPWRRPGRAWTWEGESNQRKREKRKTEGERKVMEAAAELATGGEVLRCGGAGRRPPRRRWKAGELLDAGGARRRPLSAPRRRKCAWARGPCEIVWKVRGDSGGREEGFGGGDGDSAEDMATSPTSYLVVVRGIKPRYYYQLSSSAGLYPSLLLWHVSGGTVETA